MGVSIEYTLLGYLSRGKSGLIPQAAENAPLFGKTNHHFSVDVTARYQCQRIADPGKVKFVRINLWDNMLCFNNFGDFLQLRAI